MAQDLWDRFFGSKSKSFGIEEAKWTFHNRRAPDGFIPVFMQVKDKTGYSFYPRVASIKSLGQPVDEIAVAERITAAMNYCRGKSLAELQVPH